MKKLGLFALSVLLGSMMVLMMASASFMVSPARASPLPPGLAAADLNNDGNVTLADLIGFATIYGMNSTNPAWNSPIFTTNHWNNASSADFNHDGRIDLADLATLAYCYSLNSTH